MENGKLTEKEFREVIRSGMEGCLGRGYSLEIQKISKNNGTGYEGLVIRRDGICIAPVISLEDLYREYQRGCPLGALVAEIFEIYKERASSVNIEAGQVTDWERVKGCLFLKVISTRLNKDLLCSVPHYDVLDLSVVMYVKVDGVGEKGSVHVLVKNEYLHLWRQSIDVLYEAAMRNTMNGGFVFTSITDAIKSVIDSDAVAGSLLEKDLLERESPLFMLSDRENFYGAVYMLFPQVMEEVTDFMQEDVYVLPSSVHESLIAPVSKISDLAMLQQLVCDVNRMQVLPAERLSDHVYRYRRGIGLTIAV